MSSIFVITTLTSAPAFRKRLTTSIALYAAIPAETPTTICFPFHNSPFKKFLVQNVQGILSKII